MNVCSMSQLPACDSSTAACRSCLGLGQAPETRFIDLPAEPIERVERTHIHRNQYTQHESIPISIEFKACEICGAHFKAPKSRKQRFCSVKCANNNQRIAKRATPEVKAVIDRWMDKPAGKEFYREMKAAGYVGTKDRATRLIYLYRKERREAANAVN